MIKNILFISTTTISGGILYKCFKDIYDESKMTDNTYIFRSNSIFNSGMFMGGLIGITYSYLNWHLPFFHSIKY